MMTRNEKTALRAKSGMKYNCEAGRGRVRVILKGDKWGRKNAMTHDKADPLVEFVVKGARFQYYLSTLEKFVNDGYALELEDRCGLCLDSEYAEFDITWLVALNACKYAAFIVEWNEGTEETFEFDFMCGKWENRTYGYTTRMIRANSPKDAETLAANLFATDESIQMMVEEHGRVDVEGYMVTPTLSKYGFSRSMSRVA